MDRTSRDLRVPLGMGSEVICTNFCGLLARLKLLPMSGCYCHGQKRRAVSENRPCWQLLREPLLGQGHPMLLMPMDLLSGSHRGHWRHLLWGMLHSPPRQCFAACSERLLKHDFREAATSSGSRAGDRGTPRLTVCTLAQSHDCGVLTTALSGGGCWYRQLGKQENRRV